jgi:hypothetical protein
MKKGGPGFGASRTRLVLRSPYDQERVAEPRIMRPRSMARRNPARKNTFIPTPLRVWRAVDGMRRGT